MKKIVAGSTAVLLMLSASGTLIGCKSAPKDSAKSSGSSIESQSATDNDSKAKKNKSVAEGTSSADKETGSAATDANTENTEQKPEISDKDSGSDKVAAASDANDQNDDGENGSDKAQDDKKAVVSSSYGHEGAKPHEERGQEKSGSKGQKAEEEQSSKEAPNDETHFPETMERLKKSNEIAKDKSSENKGGTRQSSVAPNANDERSAGFGNRNKNENANKNSTQNGKDGANNGSSATNKAAADKNANANKTNTQNGKDGVNNGSSATNKAAADKNANASKGNTQNGKNSAANNANAQNAQSAQSAQGNKNGANNGSPATNKAAASKADTQNAQGNKNATNAKNSANANANNAGKNANNSALANNNGKNGANNASAATNKAAADKNANASKNTNTGKVAANVNANVNNGSNGAVSTDYVEKYSKWFHPTLGDVQRCGYFYTTPEICKFNMIQGDFRKISGYKKAAYGFVFGYKQPDARGYLSDYIRFEINVDGEFACYTWDGTNYKDLVESNNEGTAYFYKNSAIYMGYNTLNTIKVEDTGKGYNVYVNGKLVKGNIPYLSNKATKGVMAFFSIGKEHQEDLANAPVQVGMRITDVIRAK